MNTRSVSLIQTAALLSLTAWAAPVAAMAQTVIAPPQAIRSAVAGATGVNSNASPVGELASIGSAYAPGLPLFKRDAIAVRPHLVYRQTHVNDLQFIPGQRVSTNMQEVSPGVLLEVGSRWTLDYTPTWTTYSSKELESSVDHSASLAGSLARGNWMFGLSQEYGSASPVLFETAQQTHFESYTTGLNAIYHLGRRTMLDMSAAHATRNADEFTRSVETSTSDWLRHELSSRISLALGFAAGFADVNPGSDMVFVRPQAQMAWNPTDKISIRAEAGTENRRFRNRTRDDLNSPVYGSTIEYSPFATTKLTLGTSRDLSTSYFANAITRNRVWRAGVEQRLLQKAYLAVRLTEYDTHYIATSREISAERDDRRRILNVSLSLPVVQRGWLSFVYQTARNSSTAQLYAFNSTQFGVEIGYRF